MPGYEYENVWLDTYEGPTFNDLGAEGWRYRPPLIWLEGRMMAIFEREIPDTNTPAAAVAPWGREEKLEVLVRDCLPLFNGKRAWTEAEGQSWLARAKELGIKL